MMSDILTQIKISSTIGSEVISVQDVKDFVRIDTSADDSLISRMITTAREWAENYMTRDIVSKSRIYYLPKVDDRFLLPFAPITSISQVEVDGTVTTDYKLFGLNEQVVLLNSLPSEEVKVTYTTTGLPDESIKQALLQLVASYYDNRSNFVVGESVNEIPTGTKTILTSFKTMFI